MKEIIPISFFVWNRLEYTKKSLNAIFENIFYPYYLFILDNNSNDKVKEYLKSTVKKLNSKYCMGVKLIQCKFSHGVFKNMQKIYKVIEKTIGNNFKYWCKIDNDTIVPPNWLNKLVKLLTIKKNLDIVQPDHYMLLPKGFNNRFEWFTTMQKEEIDIFENRYTLFYNSFVGGSGIIIRNTKVINKIMHSIRFYRKVWGWTVEQQKFINNGNNIAFFNGVFIKLLDMKNDNTRSDISDYYLKTRT